MGDAGTTRAERATQNQALFREVNERLQELATAFRDVAQTARFACECADVTCIEQMSLTVDEYEELRSHPNRFAVLPGHVVADVERVVSENDRYMVVEKLGKGAEIAVGSDPRA